MDPELAREMLNRGLISFQEANQVIDPEGPPEPEPGQEYNRTLGLAKAAGTGLIKGGIAATAGLPGDLEQLAQAGYGWATKEPPWEAKIPFKSEDIYKRIAGVLHEPQTTAEKYTEAGTEGGVSMLNPAGIAGKARMLTKGSAVLGTAMGLGGEAGREAFREHPGVGQVAGSAVPLLISLYRHGRTPNVVRGAQPYMEGLGEQFLAETGRARQAATEATGVRTLFNQGTPYGTVLDTIAKEVAAGRRGGDILNVLQEQKAAEPDLIKSFGPKYTTDLPTGHTPSSRSAYEAFAKRLSASKDPASYQDAAARFILQKGPDAFHLAVKTEFENAAEKALGTASAGRQKANALTTYVNETAGMPNSAKRAVFEKKMEMVHLTGKGAARRAELVQQGMSSQDATNLVMQEAKAVSTGASKYMDALLTLDRGRPPISTLTEFGSALGETLPAQAAKSSMVAPIRIWGQTTDRLVKRGSHQAFSDALTKPGSEKLFMEIANYNPWSQRGLTAMNALLQQSAMGQSAPTLGPAPPTPLGSQVETPAVASPFGSYAY